MTTHWLQDKAEVMSHS